MERAHCVGVRPRSFVRGLFQTNLLQATFKSVSVTSGFCPYIYIFFFALNDTYWCNIFSFDVSFSTLMSQYCIFYLNGIFDPEVFFWLWCYIFYLDVTVLRFLPPCCICSFNDIFELNVAFSTMMSQFCIFYFDKASFSLWWHFLLWI